PSEPEYVSSAPCCPMCAVCSGSAQCYLPLSASLAWGWPVLLVAALHRRLPLPGGWGGLLWHAPAANLPPRFLFGPPHWPVPWCWWQPSCFAWLLNTNEPRPVGTRDICHGQ